MEKIKGEPSQEEKRARGAAIRQEHIIALVARQTAYDRVTIVAKLQEHHNNYLAVIRDYMTPKNKKKDTELPEEQKSANQLIMGEIRGFMDRVNQQYKWRKAQTNRRQYRLNSINRKIKKISTEKDKPKDN